MPEAKKCCISSWVGSHISPSGKLGMASARAVLTMHFSAIISGCLAFLALPLPPLWANMVFVAALLTGLLILLWLEKKEPL